MARKAKAAHYVKNVYDQVWSCSGRILERSNLRGLSLHLTRLDMEIHWGPMNHQASNWRFAKKKKIKVSLLARFDLLDGCSGEPRTSEGRV